MDKTTALILAIVIIVVLAAVAIVTFVLYKKTPDPKGCENLEPDEGLCCACLKSGCPFYAQYHAAKPAEDQPASTPNKPASPSAPAPADASKAQPKEESSAKPGEKK